MKLYHIYFIIYILKYLKHDFIFFHNKISKKMCSERCSTTEGTTDTATDAGEVSCMDTFLYAQQLPDDATEGVMIIIDPVLSSVYSKLQGGGGGHPL